MSKTLALIASELQNKSVRYSREWALASGGTGFGMSGMSIEGKNAEDLCIEWLASEITRAKLIMEPLLVDSSPNPRLFTDVMTWRMQGPGVCAFIRMTYYTKPTQYCVETKVYGDDNSWNRMDTYCYEIYKQKTIRRRSSAKIEEQQEFGFQVPAPTFKITELWGL